MNEKRLWKVSFGLATCAHLALAGFSLAAIAPPATEDRRSPPQISVTAMTLQEPTAITTETLRVSKSAEEVAIAKRPVQTAQPSLQSTSGVSPIAPVQTVQPNSTATQVAQTPNNPTAALAAPTLQAAGPEQIATAATSPSQTLKQASTDQSEIQPVALITQSDTPSSSAPRVSQLGPTVVVSTTSSTVRQSGLVLDGGEGPTLPMTQSANPIAANAVRSLAGETNLSGAPGTLVEAKDAAGVPSVESTTLSVAPSATQLAVVAPESPAVSALPESKITGSSGQVATGTEVTKLSKEEHAALYQEMLKSIGAYEGGSCFAALPELDAAGEVSLRSFARTAQELVEFSKNLEDRVGLAPETILKPISDAQCAALEFASLLPTYPQFRMWLELEETDIEGRTTGNRIEFPVRGVIGNVRGGHRYLLIVDDQGLVQDLSFSMSPGLSQVRFQVDMTFKGDRVETEQMVLAIRSTSELTTIWDYSGRPAKEFFDRLNYERVLIAADIDLAMASFQVR